MFCTNCGNKMADSHKFCTECGTPRWVPVEAKTVSSDSSKIDFGTFKKSEYQYDYSMFGKIKINDGGVVKEISVELCPNDDDKISDSSKEEKLFEKSEEYKNRRSEYS